MIDVLLALRDRAIHGGSYHTTAALMSVNTTQLERKSGLYPPQISAKIQEAHKLRPILSEGNAVPVVLDIVIDAWKETIDLLGKDDFSSVWKTGPVSFRGGSTRYLEVGMREYLRSELKWFRSEHQVGTSALNQLPTTNHEMGLPTCDGPTVSLLSCFTLGKKFDTPGMYAFMPQLLHI